MRMISYWCRAQLCGNYFVVTKYYQSSDEINFELKYDEYYMM